MKESKRIRPVHNYWDYNGDGRFPNERIKGHDKRYLKRWRRHIEKQELLAEVNETDN